MDYPKRLPDMLQTGGLSLFQPYSSCALDKKKLPATQATHSVIRLQFAHPNRLGTSQVTPDTILNANFLLSLVSVVCTRRGLGKFDSPGKNETEELKFCSKFTNSQTILAYPKLRLDRWNLKNKENITIIAIICQKDLQFAIIVENWELKLLHYEHTGYQWFFFFHKSLPATDFCVPQNKGKGWLRLWPKSENEPSKILP